MSKKNTLKEPQYIRSKLNTDMLNYRVYVMNTSEKITTILMAFVIGGLVGLVFYGGQFKDDEGLATSATIVCNLIIFALVGGVAAYIYLPMRCEQLKKNRKAELTLQFRSFLDSLAVSLSSGMNMTDSLQSIYGDLISQYMEDAYIVKETKEMISGIQNNVSLEESLQSFAQRSEIEDINNFAVVFSLCYRAGGNLKDIVRRTHDIISEKLEIQQEIETALASNKSQFSAMMVIPVVMVMLLRVMSSSFAASFSTVAGVVAMTIAIGIFVSAYKIGQKIMNIGG